LPIYVTNYLFLALILYRKSLAYKLVPVNDSKVARLGLSSKRLK